MSNTEPKFAQEIQQFRHDDSRVARLRSLLAWKNIRKNVKDSDDEKGAKFDAVTVENPAIDQVAANAAENPAEAKTTEPMTTTLPWDIASYYSEKTPNDAGMFVLDKPDGGSLERLRQADKKTEGMTIQEYTAWSEYRHASFTWRKTKRFREWSGLGVIAEHKPSDDVLEILGFLTADMVQRLTEMALAMQKLEQPSGPSRPDSTASMAEKPASLFVSPDDTDPIHPRHIHQAFQNIQAWSRKKQPTLSRRTMGAGRGLMLI
ncbi:hypothetical protein TruAng_007620 [Truncatella angustata]|nr:hypothetical protein TruAng_007620 [Truncatella angustata]